MVGERRSVLSDTTAEAPVRPDEMTLLPSATTVIPSRVRACVAITKSKVDCSPSCRVTPSRACVAKPSPDAWMR
jgi:hypothetical protein